MPRGRSRRTAAVPAPGSEAAPAPIAVPPHSHLAAKAGAVADRPTEPIAVAAGPSPGVHYIRRRQCRAGRHVGRIAGHMPLALARNRQVHGRPSIAADSTRDFVAACRSKSSLVLLAMVDAPQPTTNEDDV